jgi:hypothetical protein
MRALFLTLGSTILVATSANAQFLPNRPPPGSPLSGGIGSAPSTAGFSPYLNLAQGGNSAAVNYYGIVRPQVSMQSQLQTLQAQQQAGGSASYEPDDPTMPGLVVGTRVRFLNTGGYFLNLQGGTPSQGATGGGFAAGMSGRSGGGTGMATAGTGSLFGSGLSGFGTGLGGNRSGSRGPKQ